MIPMYRTALNVISVLRFGLLFPAATLFLELLPLPVLLRARPRAGGTLTP